MIWSDSKHSQLFLYKIKNILFFFFSVCRVFRAVIYASNIGVTFIVQRVFPNLDQEYVFIWFIKHGYYFVELTVKVHENRHLMDDLSSFFYFSKQNFTNIYLDDLNYFYSLCSHNPHKNRRSCFFIPLLKPSSNIFLSKGSFMFQNSTVSPNSIWILKCSKEKS